MDADRRDDDHPVYCDPGVSRSPQAPTKAIWFGDFSSYYRRHMGLPPKDGDSGPPAP